MINFTKSPYWARLDCVLALTCTGFMLLPSTVAAQEVEEVIIQAEAQEKPLNDLVSVSALDGEKLADAGIENVEDVAAYVPNLVLTQTDTGTNIVIRGIGAGVNQGFDQSVGLYIDGVPLPRSQMARAPFLDLANVQVLRGPQYVLDGNYSIAGSVHMETNMSADEFEAGLDFNFVPSQKDRKLLFTAGIPVSDSISARIALQAQKADGYIENVTRNEDGPGRDELLARLVLDWNPTESTTVKFKLESGQFDTRGRQIEIIQSESVPDIFDLEAFPQTQIGFNRFREPVISTGVSFDLRSRNDFDRITYSQQILWDIAVSTDYSTFVSPDGTIGLFDTVAGSTPEQIAARREEEFRYNGTSYLQLLADAYTDPNIYRNPDGPHAVPPGLLDATLDFQRGADAEEYSFNDSLNITLNIEQSLGEHQLNFTASYIDYALEERIDSDFTAAPLFVTEQQEDYEQQFYRAEFNSVEGEFLEIKAGVTYLDSELSFNDFTDLNLINPADQFSPGDTDDQIAQAVATANLIFNPSHPLDSFLGRTSTPSTEFYQPLRYLSPFRFFNQEADIFATFFQAKMNLSDTLRTTVGLRYTHSEKTASRELVLLADGGVKLTQEALDAIGEPRGLTEIVSAAQFGYGGTFGIFFHSDLYDEDFRTGPQGIRQISRAEGALEDVRTEEALLPSLTIEWDATEDLSLLASVRKAAKLGGFDARSNSTPDVPAGSAAPPGSFEFEDEVATTYELGAKWYLPAGLGELYSTLFYTNFQDLQISIFDGRSGFNVVNAGEAEATGVELEGLLNITDAFNVNLSLAWMDFNFVDFPLAACYFGRLPDTYRIVALPLNTVGTAFEGLSPGDQIPIVYPPNSFYDLNGDGIPTTEFPANNPATGDDPDLFPLNDYFSGVIQRLPSNCDFEGETNQYVAEWQGTVSFNYEKEVASVGLFKPTLDVIYNSGYFTSSTLDPDVAQEAYFQFHGRLALASLEDTWEVAITGQNLTDEKIISYANELPVATRVMGSKSNYGFVNSPRAVGLNLRYKFY